MRITLQDALYQMNSRKNLLKNKILSNDPELLKILSIYTNEAIEARKLIDSDLNNLNSNPRILEVGAGSLALSVQLASEGFNITAIEPIGIGFSPLKFLLEAYLELASAEKIPLTFIDTKIQDYNNSELFDYVFSINVMEHVEDLDLVIKSILNLMKPKSVYRINCPNYNFPYEPHFGKWLWKRNNSAFVLSWSSLSENILRQDDKLELLLSLNYITLKKIRLISNNFGCKMNIDTDALYSLVTRSLNDPELQSRHRTLMPLVKILKFTGLTWILKLWPSNFQPTISATIEK